MVVCISKVKDIEKLISELKVLQNRIGTHRITEILKYVLRGIGRDTFRVLVDAWPEWDFLLVEHKTADETLASGFATSLSVWAKTEHRGKGFAKAVLIKISKACKDRGLRALSMVHRVNTSSMGVFQNIPGATQLPGTMITGIIKS